MRLIKSNNIESEYPKHHVCDECGAELEYDKEDTYIDWLGCAYVTCPACDNEIMVSNRIQSPTWKATFYHTSTETGAVDIEDVKIQEYVDKTVKPLCSDERKTSDFYMIKTGNLFIIGIKWKDGIEIYVTKDYWEDNIAPEDYGMIK